jgi:hypothetical protein
MESEAPAWLWFLVPVLFVTFFSALWLGVTSLLGLLSGWYRLQKAFPDRIEQQPLAQLRGQTGMMGGLALMPVNFKHCLRLDICPTGLRVAVFKLLGPFQRPFFVPWSSITAERGRFLFGTYYRLNFGTPPVGALSLHTGVVQKIAATGPLRLPDEQTAGVQPG